jgi:fatty acid omega-hydroxylase
MPTTRQYITRGAVATLSTLALIYNDRAVFSDKRADLKTQAGWPIVGNLPLLLEFLMRIHEFIQEGFTRLDCMTL